MSADSPASRFNSITDPLVRERSSPIAILVLPISTDISTGMSRRLSMLISWLSPSPICCSAATNSSIVSPFLTEYLLYLHCLVAPPDAHPAFKFGGVHDRDVYGLVNGAVGDDDGLFLHLQELLNRQFLLPEDGPQLQGHIIDAALQFLKPLRPHLHVFSGGSGDEIALDGLENAVGHAYLHPTDHVRDLDGKLENDHRLFLGNHGDVVR